MERLKNRLVKTKLFKLAVDMGLDKLPELLPHEQPFEPPVDPEDTRPYSPEQIADMELTTQEGNWHKPGK
ncbi:hypothetical protein A2803_00300 [Candidatus Woesebacteria bacterium RIFCSPHIGHO2_01_FULL_44_21]|uniref:Uncharacterized protein n=1 Tax=Candidatus Woesebacteria bacterium RIFCSPHIGHO2_01_FULL_44_21 TaxID=1802503 RepID=A0A1F7YXD8_9BACT|nr:MAG: hypothetical protein A2803_00300 [Candidatus Woesebacteria bacterium RIFCSPHIGHO2_01_FULL_44_21]OGM68911.1 MAG: hypothetical protein A2897_01995 [Candidatus Woesebacteria bacterium RIFCSPLOWO2_01_FULL_44_24b]